jgi:hypothetical protein
MQAMILTAPPQAWQVSAIMGAFYFSPKKGMSPFSPDALLSA